MICSRTVSEACRPYLCQRLRRDSAGRVLLDLRCASLTHHLVVWPVWSAAAAGAIIGDGIGYGIGAVN